MGIHAFDRTKQVFPVSLQDFQLTARELPFWISQVCTWTIKKRQVLGRLPKNCAKKATAWKLLTKEMEKELGK
jgi:hypothetical protein